MLAIPNKKFKSFFKTVSCSEGHECFYRTRLDTFGCGCAHDCSYCYAKSCLEFRNLWDPTYPRISDIVEIEKRISKLTPGSIVRLGGMTDCFQLLELTHRVTLETIKFLNKQRVGYLVVTKAPSVANPEYIEIMDRELAHIQISVTSLDPVLTAKYENAAPPDKRIEALMTLQEQGFDVALRLSPLIEEFMDFDQLNRLKVQKTIVEFLRINHWIKQWLSGVDYSKYTLLSGNYWHPTLDEKRRVLNRITLPNISICEKVPEHYDYWKTHFNPNPADCCNLRVSSRQNITEAEGAASTPATGGE